MKINKISFRNFRSYGNALQNISFSDEGEFILISGVNGAGKCLSPDTMIEILVDNEEIKVKLLKFLENRKIPL